MQDESISPIRGFFRKKWVIITLAVNVVIIVGVVAIAIYNSTKNAIIKFAIAPIDATIAVNGNDSYHNGSYQFQPGDYEVTISYEGLDSKIFNINLQPNTTIAVTTFLSENGNFDYYTYKDNNSSYLMLTRIASSSDNQTTDNDTSAEEFILQQEKNDSISEYTPIRFSVCEMPATRINCDAVEVTYDFSDSCNGQKCLIVKGREETLTDIVTDELASQLSIKGYDLNNYRYIYEQDTEI